MSSTQAPQLDFLQKILEAPESLLMPTEQQVSDLRKATKMLYEYCKATEPSKLGTLRALAVDGFDAEAIWAQLQLRNEPANAHFSRRNEQILTLNDAQNTQLIRALLVNKSAESKKPQPKTKSVGSKKVANVDLESDDGADESDLDSDAEAQLRAELEAELEEELAEEANGSDDEQSNEEDESEQDVEDDSQLDDSEGMDEEPSNEAESESEHDQSDQEDQSAGDGDSEDENTEAFFARANESKSDYKVSRERFFSASKFEHMMDDLEETDGLDFEVDLNSADAGDDEEEEEEEEEEAAPKRRKTNIAASQKADADAKYSDFFDAPPPQDEVSSDDEAEQADETEEVAGPQSEYEKFMAKMKADIGELEAEAVAPKQWHMAGEASARQRPESALLETHLEFETAAKVAPPITEESTAELETLIKRRCRDMAFDDVVRKVDMKARGSFKAPLELNGEKSALGLADIYAQEFLAQSQAAAADAAAPDTSAHGKAQAAKNASLPKEHAEIAELFAELCYKLDAMSNQHFTPRPASLDLKVQPNTAALQMEEVLPMSVSDAQARAPQEVYRSHGAVGETERDKQERTAARRAHKVQRAAKDDRALEDARTVERLNPLSAYEQIKKNTEKLEARKPIKLQQSKNLKVAAATDETKYTRSHDVFAKLDDEQKAKKSGIARQPIVAVAPKKSGSLKL